jgi:hypothetical protein
MTGGQRGIHKPSLRDRSATQTEEKMEANEQERIQASAIQAFSRIRVLLRGMKPLRLLSRICIQYGFAEASEAGAVEWYASPWGSWLGITARLICGGDCGTGCSGDPTRGTVDKLSRELAAYWDGVIYPTPADESNSSRDDVVAMLAEDCRTHAVTVKHEAFPYQLWEAARRLYSPKDEWLKNNCGFTIEEAIAVMRGISDTVCSRVRREIGSFAQGFTATMIQEKKYKDVVLPALDREPDMAILTEAEVATACHVSREACKAVLARFSQHVQEPACDETSETALNPLQLPFEFNEMRARPLIEIRGRYVCPELQLLSEALFLSPHFDLISDESILGTYGNDRGAWLERATADYLESVFGSDAVYLNPFRDNGEELCDVLVYYDSIVIVVSCKAKMLTELAEYGNDAVRLKDDLQKGIGDSCAQVEGALAYLRRSDTVTIFHSNGELWTTVKSTELDALLPVYVLPNRYQNLTINVRNVLSGLGLQVGVDGLPWVVSVFDLQHVAEILNETPAVFLDYVAGRREMALVPTHIGADEMDLLGHYLNQGLCFGDGSPYCGLHGVALVNSSAGVDTYLGTVHELGRSAEKPRCKSPIVQSGLVDEIVQTKVPHRTAALIRLLSLNGTDATDFVEHIRSCREQTLLTSEPCCYTVGVKHGSTTSVFTYFAGMGGTSAATQQARAWAREQLYPRQQETWNWVCLVGDVARSARVQSVIYVPRQPCSNDRQ